VKAPTPSGYFIVNSYGGYSKKGYAPYNPRKRNQDALVMAEDPNTRSLLLCVMDGHGEDGDKVSQHIKGKFVTYLFGHESFATDIQAALTEVIARCESELLKGETL
jgi:serine/threonine protein phosphatase PrpC